MTQSNAKETPLRRGRRSRLSEAIGDALGRWLIACLVVAGVALSGEAEDAGARDEAPAAAPEPSPSPLGQAAEYRVGGFDAAAGWAETPRRIVARPSPNPRRSAAPAIGVASFSAEPPEEAVAAAQSAPTERIVEDIAVEDIAAPAATPVTPPAAAGGLTRPLTGGAGADDALPQSPRSGLVGYMVARVDTGEVIAARNADEPFIPASVTKVPTALYAIDSLGLDFRFRTRLIATGPLVGGVLRGDLILSGGGDPTLDSGDLARLVAELKAAGVNRVAGRFIYDDRALPRMEEIEPGQPVYASYNPGLSGLSLNFNRVLMRWSRQNGGGYDIEMRAHAARRQAPATGYEAALLPPEDRALFRRSARDGAGGRRIQVWSVSERNLGRRGQRWLPVQDPSLYAANAFRSIATDEGVQLPEPVAGAAPLLDTAPDGPRLLAEHLSEPLSNILSGMLKYSTNLTAEVIGLTASGVRHLAARDVRFRASAADPSRDLALSGDAMARWVNETYGLGAEGAGGDMIFYNHSGLTAASRVTPRAMTQLLVNAAADPARFAEFYELMPVRTGRGVRNTALVRAKTGTIYYGRALVGYIECRASGERYAFAFFNSDATERASFDLSIDVNAPAPPRSARIWLNRAMAAERALMTRWTTRLCG